VPLYLDAPSTTGVPALALDVWMSYELRRAGFDADAVWPRPTDPRIMPSAIAACWRRCRSANAAHRTAPAAVMKGVSSSRERAGQAYMKQVDVIITMGHRADC
jgi:hypothetical protein